MNNSGLRVRRSIGRVPSQARRLEPALSGKPSSLTVSLAFYRTDKRGSRLDRRMHLARGGISGRVRFNLPARMDSYVRPTVRSTPNSAQAAEPSERTRRRMNTAKEVNMRARSSAWKMHQLFIGRSELTLFLQFIHYFIYFLFFSFFIQSNCAKIVFDRRKQFGSFYHFLFALFSSEYISAIEIFYSIN